jgi:hypothetical protein
MMIPEQRIEAINNERREDESPFPIEPPNSPKTVHSESVYDSPLASPIVVKKFEGANLPPLPKGEPPVDANELSNNNAVVEMSLAESKSSKLESALTDDAEMILWESVEGCFFPTYWKLTDTAIQVDNLDTFCAGLCCTYSSETVMLSSVSDVALRQTFWGRIFGDRGNIEIYTNGTGSTVSSVNANQNYPTLAPSAPKLVIETGEARKLYRMIQVQLSKISREKFMKHM